MMQLEHVTEAQILDAIRRFEFAFFYQPKVSLVTGKVVGVEALMRWVRPDGSVLLPEQFVSVAERTNLICTLTRQMFPWLVNDFLELLGVDEKLKVSFNASARDFLDDAFARQVLREYEHARLPAQSVLIELTETANVTDGIILTHLQTLHRNGVPLVLDDFGKGYSSLERLSKCPFSAIKLDRSTVGSMLHSEKSSSIVDSAVQMAHRLGMDVVAEGVETPEQYNRLVSSGCTLAQGFWISKPLPLKQALHFIRQGGDWPGRPVGLIHMIGVDHMQWRRDFVGELFEQSLLSKERRQLHHLRELTRTAQVYVADKSYRAIAQVFRQHPALLDLERTHQAMLEVVRQLVNAVAKGAGPDVLSAALQELSQQSLKLLASLQALENAGLANMHSSSEIQAGMQGGFHYPHWQAGNGGAAMNWQ